MAIIICLVVRRLCTESLPQKSTEGSATRIAGSSETTRNFRKGRKVLRDEISRIFVIDSVEFRVFAHHVTNWNGSKAAQEGIFVGDGGVFGVTANKCQWQKTSRGRIILVRTCSSSFSLFIGVLYWLVSVAPSNRSLSED